MLYFIFASAMLTLAPGPDILYLLAKSLSSGARRGIILALGLCSGLAFHTALVACGISAIISQSVFLFHLLKYAGASYLLYLAWLCLHEDGEILLDSSQGQQTCGQLYCRGLLMNILNPKVILFFLAFLPQFVESESAWSIPMQIIMLGMVFGIQAFCIFTVVALFSALIRSRILSIPGISRILERVQAATLFCISIALLLG